MQLSAGARPHRPEDRKKKKKNKSKKTAERYKTVLCRRYKRSGTCPAGDECTFAHGMEELRDAPPNKKELLAMQKAMHPVLLFPNVLDEGPVHRPYQPTGPAVSIARPPQKQQQPLLFFETDRTQPHQAGYTSQAPNKEWNDQLHAMFLPPGFDNPDAQQSYDQFSVDSLRAGPSPFSVVGAPLPAHTAGPTTNSTSPSASEVTIVKQVPNTNAATTSSATPQTAATSATSAAAPFSVWEPQPLSYDPPTNNPTNDNSPPRERSRILDLIGAAIDH